MELQHRFSVPTPVEETWTHFTDISSVAECFPGATVTSVEDDAFKGTVKVKLGPIALVYAGSGTFVERDEAGHRFVVEAKGKDKRGNGTAGATVTLTMSDAAGATDVEVLTDLAVTGKPAQFGRGVMQDVSDKLLGQFVSCLEQRLATGGVAAAPLGDEPAPMVPEEPRDEASRRAPSPEDATGAAAAAAGTAAKPDPAAPEPAAGESAAPAAPTGAVPDPAAPERPRAAAGVPPPRPTPLPSPAKQDDAINLGATVLPILVRTYWKPAAAVVAVLLVLWWLVARD